VHRLNDCQEGSCVLRVAIVKEIAVASKDATSFHGDVPSHLLHPLLGRVGGDPGDLHLSALEMNEEQHIVGHQSLQDEDLNCEKVSSHEQREVSPNEFCPRGPTIGCGSWTA